MNPSNRRRVRASRGDMQIRFDLKERYNFYRREGGEWVRHAWFRDHDSLVDYANGLDTVERHTMHKLLELINERARVLYAEHHPSSLFISPHDCPTLEP